MQQSGLGPKQVTQVRGYADQRLRRPQDPESPANRRISVIVHDVVKPTPDDEDRPLAKGSPASAPGEHH
jgi:hypothetical protein